MFAPDERAALAHKAASYSVKLLRRGDQCLALLAASHLYWQALGGGGEGGGAEGGGEGVAERAPQTPPPAWLAGWLTFASWAGSETRARRR